MGACHSKGSATYSTKGKNTEKNMVDNENGWDYRGIAQRVDKMETTLKKTKSFNTIASIYRQASNTEKLITDEIERLHNNTADVPGNEKALLTQRRRVREILRNIKNKG